MSGENKSDQSKDGNSNEDIDLTDFDVHIDKRLYLTAIAHQLVNSIEANAGKKGQKQSAKAIEFVKAVMTYASHVSYPIPKDGIIIPSDVTEIKLERYFDLAYTALTTGCEILVEILENTEKTVSFKNCAFDGLRKILFTNVTHHDKNPEQKPQKSQLQSQESEETDA